MTDLTIDLAHRVKDFLTDLQPKQFKQVAQRIFGLLKMPFPQDCKHLAGHPGVRRIDVGEYRVCYDVTNGVVRILVVGPRNDDAVYKELRRVKG